MVALKFNTITNLKLYNMIVEKSTGYGVLGFRLYGNSSITDCLFQNNSGTREYIGGNVAISYTYCHLTKKDTKSYLFIEGSTFRYGRYVQNATHPFASGLVIYLSCSNVQVSVHDTNFTGNKGLGNRNWKRGGGGNMAVIFLFSPGTVQNSVSISNSLFHGGKSTLGGGLFLSYYSGSRGDCSNTLVKEECYNNVAISNSRFYNNNAIYNGGGIYFLVAQGIARGNNSNTNFVLRNCTFVNNTVQYAKDTGIAMTIDNVFIDGMFDMSKYVQFTALIVNCDFSHNRQHFISHKDLFLNDSIKSDAQSETGSAVLLISEQSGYITIKDTHIHHNLASAIGAFRSRITFEGNVTIINNTGIDGGGIFLCEASYMILTPNVTVTIARNHAVNTGGGIYIGRHCTQISPLCFFLLHHNRLKKKTFTVKLANNTAVRAGTQLFGGSVETCYLPTYSRAHGKTIFLNIFYYSEHEPSDYSYVTSDPIQVCFCIDGKPNCSIHNIHVDHAVYPGGTFKVPAVVVGQLNGTVPGIVVTRLAPPLKKTTNLGLGERRQYLEKNCTAKLKYTVYSMDTFEKLTLSIEDSGFVKNVHHASLSKHIHVALKPCPFGFEQVFVKNASCKCIRSPDIYKFGFRCFINQTIRRPLQHWIGVYSSQSVNGSNSPRFNHLIYHEKCPLDYCRDEVVYIDARAFTIDQDAQCANNRTGVLCGHCSDGFSAILGSSRCLNCTVVGYKVMFAIVTLYAVAGVVLVVLLVICNLTVTECTLSGLIFYVNVFSLLMPIYVPRTTNLSPIQRIVVFLVSLFNLDMDIELCFYNGMTRYAKNWLEFLFPIYIWAIAGVVIYFSRKYRRFANTIGDKAVQVLATLFLLSYMKINQAVVDALSFTELSLPGPNGSFVNKLVWLNDGNIRYLHGKHIPLFMCGAFFAILSLTYTLVLLFIQPLQKYNHLKCFKWVAKLKPLVDAYTSPRLIKQTNRFWNGFLLSIRVTLIIYFAINFTNDPHANLLGVVSACIIVLTIAWSVGGIYTKWQLNVLNSFSLINLAAISIISLSHYSHFDKHERNTQNCQNVISIVSLSIVLLVFIGVLLYHLHCLLVKGRCYERAKSFFQTKAMYLNNCCNKRPQYQRVLVHTLSYTESENSENENDNDSNA